MTPRLGAVYLDLTFSDETWGIRPPMPRWLAEAACFDFSRGVPWIDGRRVTRALFIPWIGGLQ
jgi:hypothetical protein